MAKQLWNLQQQVERLVQALLNSIRRRAQLAGAPHLINAVCPPWQLDQPVSSHLSPINATIRGK
jgi:hypothetical protein